jgi:hypothetical protein
LEQHTGERGKSYMKKNTASVRKEYQNLPEWESAIGTHLVPDFLPSPEELAGAITLKKITISLGDDTVQFFKSQAEILGCPYQTMIRELLDVYVRKMRT